MRDRRAQVQSALWLAAAAWCAWSWPAAPVWGLTERAPGALLKLAAAEIPALPRAKPSPRGGIETQGVRLSARTAVDRPPIGADLRWTVEPVAGDGEAVTSTQPLPAIELQPGRYRARAMVGAAEGEAEFTVERGEVARVSVVLDAGELEVTVSAGAAQMALDQVAIRLRSAGDAGGVPLASATGGRLVSVLPAGDYEVEARLGAVTGRTRVAVSAGSVAKAEIALEVGYVIAQALAAEGTEPLASASFSLWPAADGGTEDGEDGVIARTGGRHGIFMVAPGEYRLAAEFGLAAGARTVRVGANRLTTVTVNLEAARLGLDAIGPDSGNGLGAGTPALYRVFRGGAGDSIEPISEIEAARPTLRLPAGDFTVEAERDGLVARESVSLAPGEPGSLLLVLAPAELALTATANGKPLDGANVAISATPVSEAGDNTGPPLELGTLEDQPVRLPAGHYRITGRLLPGGAEAEAAVTLAAGAEGAASLDFEIGHARIEVLDKPAGKAADGAWMIIEPADGGSTIKLVGGDADLLLAPGSYSVVAAAGSRAATGLLTVTAGNETALSLVPQ